MSRLLDICVHPLTWSSEDNKTFEIGLARFFHDCERWTKIARLLPNKSLNDIQRHFERLQQDVNLIQDSYASVEVQETAEDYNVKRIKTESKQIQQPAPLMSASMDKRKGVAWTPEEHRLFLLGLSKFGKGSWRSISRQLVITRTPTQVASHAQKYFLRLNSMTKSKEKRRASIHDTTTDHLASF